MADLRYFRWIADEAESIRLCAEGARICEASLETHHAHHAILHEITPEQASTAHAKERG